MEDFENYVFVVLRMLYLSEGTSEAKSEQVSFILGNNFIISFQEVEGGCLQHGTRTHPQSPGAY